MTPSLDLGRYFLTKSLACQNFMLGLEENNKKLINPSLYSIVISINSKCGISTSKPFKVNQSLRLELVCPSPYPICQNASIQLSRVAPRVRETGLYAT